MVLLCTIVYYSILLIDGRAMMLDETRLIMDELLIYAYFQRGRQKEDKLPLRSGRVVA